MRLWDVLTGQQIGRSMQHDGNVNGARMIDGDTRILSWTADSSVRLWDGSSGEQIGSSMQHDGPVAAAEISKDKTRSCPDPITVLGYGMWRRTSRSGL